MEILEQLRLLKQLFSYGLIGEIVIAVGLLITFFYQRHKIGSLEMQIKSQKGILDSAKAFFDLFDLDKLRGYAEIREEKTRIEKDIELKKIKEEFEEKIKKEKVAGEFVSGQFVILLDSILDALFYLPGEFRNKVIHSMGEGVAKGAIKKAVRRLEEMEAKAGINALSRALSIEDKGKD